MTMQQLIEKTASRFRDKIALRCEEYEVTFSELNATVNRIANGFLDMGYEKGDRVALFMENSHQYMEYRLALEKAGIVYVPLNLLLSKKDVTYILQNAGAKGAVCDSNTVGIIASLREKLPSLEWIFTIDKENEVRDERDKIISYRYLLGKYGNQEPPSDTEEDDLCSINYTSGTTGKPKGVMLTQRNWLEVYKNMLIDRDFQSGERLLHVGPLTHASGSYFMPFFLRGSENIIISRKNKLDSFFDVIEKYKITAFTCVPTILVRIMDDPRIGQIDKSSLKVIGYGAAPMPKKQIKRAMEIFGPILEQNYGQTEAYMTVSYLSKKDHEQALGSHEERLASIGRPYTFVAVEIMDNEGNIVGSDQVGELVIKSSHMTSGYWNLPEETQKAFKKGWLLTGDLAKKDAEGFIYLLGRKKEMIISGGFNIYPQEVENVLYALSFVKEAAVIGMECEDWGEKVVAFLVVEEAGQVSELQKYCQDNLGFKKPKEYILIDSMPKNSTGKIDKKKLKELYREKESAEDWIRQ